VYNFLRKNLLKYYTSVIYITCQYFINLTVINADGIK
jgi:hypothetical protein